MDRLNAISSGEAQFASLGETAMLSAMAQGNRRFYWIGNQDIHRPGAEQSSLAVAIEPVETPVG
jgi:hypothetical protein